MRESFWYYRENDGSVGESGGKEASWKGEVREGEGGDRKGGGLEKKLVSGMRRRDGQIKREGESQMTITLLTSVQH